MNKQDLGQQADAPRKRISAHLVTSGGKPKKSDGKTMFNLPQEAHEIISTVNRIGKFGMRELIDKITSQAQEACKEDRLELLPLPGACIKKSYSISGEAKSFLSGLAREKGISRDGAFYSCVMNYFNAVAVNTLSNQKKLEYARTLLDMAKRMQEIFAAPEAVEAREALLAADDPDFGYEDVDTSTCGGCLLLVSNLVELPACLEEYIKRKESAMASGKEA